MSDIAAHEPLAVGLIGLSPDGLHLFEVMSGGGPFRVVMTWNGPSDPHGFGLPSVDVLWLARPCGFDEPFAEQLLHSGKPIVAELPLGLSAERMQSILAEARSRGIPVLSHCPRRSDDDFRRALSAVLSSDLGKLLAAKWVSWSYGAQSASCAHDDGSQIRATLLRLLAHAVDQLLQLIPVEPLRVVAFGDSALSIQAIIEFHGGLRAEIDLRLDSPLPFQTGWLLTGDRGGFADGRCFHVAADGEVFDSRVPTIESGVDQYVELAQRLRVIDHRATETDRTVTVTKLLAAISSSAQSGEVMLISPV